MGRPSRGSYRDRADRRPPPPVTLDSLLGLPPQPAPDTRRKSFEDLFAPPPTDGEKQINPLAAQLEKVLEDAGERLPGELSADVAVAMVEAMAKEFKRDFRTSELSTIVRIMVEAGEEKIRRLQAAREDV